MRKFNRDQIFAHEERLLHLATDRLKQIEGLTIYGSSREKASLITFSIKGIHPLDLGVLIGLKGIALRTGVMCANPTLHHFGLQSAARISFGLYNTEEEIDLFANALEETISVIYA
jgi:cysteine desulfurase/selenocysteine lyase